MKIEELIYNDEVIDINVGHFHEQWAINQKAFFEALRHPQVTRIEFDHYDSDRYSGASSDCKIWILREETKEEELKRIELAKKRSEAAKKAAKTRKANNKAKEDKEKELYLKLKKKYEI